ncbi:MAG: hypothetical protein MUC45_09865 [Actinomycetia bacterium]|jgi:hypothetical protein|nr:hypothetical protein [Actinomycetes bacterium]
MITYVVVANQTLGGEPLNAKLAELVADGPCALHLVAPATKTEGEKQWDYPVGDRTGPNAATLAHALASGRLQQELARLRAAGVEVDGEVVDHDPVARVRELVAGGDVAAVVVCTLPAHLSRWLRTDLPHRISRAVSVPVIHVEGAAGPSL